MLYLSALNPSFEQVVAIDAGFGIFSRAWCIAELVAANDTGMAQHLKLYSADTLVRQENFLRELNILNMEASCAEDKINILAGIDDTDAFNAHLQHLLFDELFPTWR